MVRKGRFTSALRTLDIGYRMWREQVLTSGGSPFTPGDAALPARAAAAAAEAGDFHWHLAFFDRGRDTRCGSAPRHWRWRVRCLRT